MPELPPSLRDVPPQDLFPGVYARDPHHAGFARGGRAAAEAALDRVLPEDYGRTRSHLAGKVSRLSPYIRYGVLGLPEVRDVALTRVRVPSGAWKYVNELSWRDYYSRVYAELGDRIWQDFGAYKTGLPASAYAETLPGDVAAGETGAVCIDSWAHEMAEHGYLHNHARMWLASYVVHHRRVRWQAGSRWFLTHLLDGDPASNNLSWQWVASTWRNFPYLWNRGNLLKYAGDQYCARCPLADGGCPFDATYAALSERLFPSKKAAEGETGHLDPALLKNVPDEPLPVPMPAPDAIVWVHGDRLSPTNEALAAYADRPAVFVWDDALLQEWTISAKRLTFLHESVRELPVHVLRGDVAEQIAVFARAHGSRTVATTPSPSPRWRAIVDALRAKGFTVQVWPGEPFARSLVPLDLRVHADYWNAVRASAFGREPELPKPRRERKKKDSEAAPRTKRAKKSTVVGEKDRQSVEE